MEAHFLNCARTVFNSIITRFMEIDKKSLRALVADGDVDALLTALMEIAEQAGQADWRNYLLQVSANWNAGQKRVRLNTISGEQAKLEFAQTIDTLNHFINNLPDRIQAGNQGAGVPHPVGLPGTKRRSGGVYLIAGIGAIAILLGLAYAAGVFNQNKPQSNTTPTNLKIDSTAREAAQDTKKKVQTPVQKTKPVQEDVTLFNSGEKTEVGVAVVSGRERNTDLAQKIAAVLRKKGISASHSVFLHTFYKQQYFYAIVDDNPIILTRLQAKARMRYALLIRQNDVVVKEKAASTGPALARESNTGAATAEATFDILMLDAASGKVIEQTHPRLQAASPADLGQALLNWIAKKSWKL